MTSRDTKAAAKKAGVGYRTLREWLALSHFRDALRDAQAEMIGAAIRRLSNATGGAVDALEGVLASDAAPGGLKVRAADVVLSRLLSLAEAHELERRIAALEGIAERNGKANV